MFNTSKSDTNENEQNYFSVFKLSDITIWWYEKKEFHEETVSHCIRLMMLTEFNENAYPMISLLPHCQLYKYLATKYSFVVLLCSYTEQRPWIIWCTHVVPAISVKQRRPNCGYPAHFVLNTLQNVVQILYLFICDDGNEATVPFECLRFDEDIFFYFCEYNHIYLPRNKWQIIKLNFNNRFTKQLVENALFLPNFQIFW